MEFDFAQQAQLAQQVSAVLIPYLVKGAEAFAGETGKRLAAALWDKFKPKVEEKDPEGEIVQDMRDNPEDKGAQTAFEYQIKKILEKDRKFAEEISITIGNIDLSSIQAGDKSVIGRDFNNAQVATGDRNIQIGSLKLYFDSRRIETPAEQEKVQKAFRAYLEKLRRHCNALPLAALGGDENADEEITLDKVYIELDTTQPKEDPEGKSARRVKVGSREISLPSEKQTPISVIEAAIETNRMVVLGDAGAGKSTFVKELLALQSAVLLGETKEPLEGFSPDLIPVFVVLRELAPRLVKLNLGNLSTEKQKVALADAVFEKIHDDVRSLKADDFVPVLKEAVENGKLLLVLDGLDEVPQDARGLIRQAVGALIQLHKIERIIITSRSRSYTGQAVFPNFQPFTIARFDQEKIQQFARAWYNERHRLGHIPKDQIEPRANNLSAAATDPDLIEMSGNPMMLTSIALLHQRDIGLPRERVKLYNLIVTVLISRWQKYKTGEEDFVPSEHLARFLKDDNKLRSTLELLAYETHRTGMEIDKSKRDEADADLSRSRALTLLERPENIGDLSLASEFLDYVDQRAGLLMGKGGDLDLPTSYSFPHRTIQEYLAGCHLIGKREPGREIFDHAAMGDFWSLAALMGAEELFYNRRNENTLLDLAYYLCSSNNPETEQEERAVLWSGQFANVLGLDIIQRDIGNPRSGREYLEQLIPLTVDLLNSTHLTSRERAEAGDTLARLGDPRPGVTNDFIFCELPASKFLMGNTEKTDEMSFDDERPQFEYDIKHNYFISRYPVTNAQFGLFLNDPEGYADERWFTDAGKEWRKQAKREKPPKPGGSFDLPNHPVVNVTWYEAVAFTRWLTNKMRRENSGLKVWKKGSIKDIAMDFEKWEVRLPTEAEWEKAARWKPSLSGRGKGEGESLRYPWGDNFVQDNVNSNMIVGSTSAVGCFPGGKSPYGALDMSGNVWEWCATQWTGNYKDYAKNENNNLEGDVLRVLRGGAFYDDEGHVRCAYRLRVDPYFRPYSLGFRVVVASPISPGSGS